MIDPKLETISQFFKGDFQFVVPDYQRPYSWKNQEVGELIEDISACIGKPHGLYLGTIILDVSDRKAKKLEIVDGQQRITSIFLLLIACRDHAREIGHQDRAQATQQKISFTDEIENKTIGMKLLASSSIRAVFEHMADSTWDGTFPDSLGKIPVRRVKSVYEYFRKQLKPHNVTQLGAFQGAIYATEVIRIDIDGKDEAFAIFERTNARGMDLEVADLLKNFLHQQKIKSIQDDWKEIVKNAAQSMLRMLKAFYVAHRGPVQKAELYRKLHKLASELGSPELFVEQLLIFSRYYAYLSTIGTNAEKTKEYFESVGFSAIAKHQDRFSEAHGSLQALRQFKVLQTQPIVFAAMLSIERLKLKSDASAAKAFVRLVKTLESFHFINTYVCSHIGNEVEKLYATACREFGAAEDFIKAVDGLVNGLRNKVAPIAEFRENFVQIEYSAQSLGKLAYIFDRFNNCDRKVGERKQIFYPDPLIFRRHFSVEHIYAQKTAQQKGVLPVVGAKLIDNIGNLTVLSLQLNSELGNKSVEDKFKIMRGKAKARVSEFPEVVALVAKYGSSDEQGEAGEPVWNDETIKQRARDLADLGFSKVWAV